MIIQKSFQNSGLLLKKTFLVIIKVENLTQSIDQSFFWEKLFTNPIQLKKLSILYN